MRIAIGSDHAGYKLKAALLNQLSEREDELIDFGCHDEMAVDFPDVAKLVCKAILDGEAERGIMFCGSGVGAAIACNKVPGIRASVCHDIYTAHQCVEHDAVQIITMGSDIIGPVVALELIDIFLNARFSGGDEFKRRIAKLQEMEKVRE